MKAQEAFERLIRALVSPFVILRVVANSRSRSGELERTCVVPMHNWKLVEAGIFPAFHHNWITAISNALNAGLLPPEYYALPEQQAAGFGPDVLTLQGLASTRGDESVANGATAHVALQAANAVHGRVGCRVLPQEEKLGGRSAREWGPHRIDGRNRLARKQIRTTAVPCVHRQSVRSAGGANPPVDRGSVPARSARPRGAACGDLGRGAGRTV